MIRTGGMVKKIGLIVGAVIATLGIGIGASSMAHAYSLANTQMPPGFSITSVAEDLFIPTAAQFAPDGRIFVTEKGGTVKIVKNGQVLANPFYTVPNVNDYGDRGLLGLALDPNFATNNYVYLLYTHDTKPASPEISKVGRLLRITANGDTALPGSEKIILGTNAGSAAQPSCDSQPLNADCIPADGISHGPGTLAFGSDGKLYMSFGESSDFEEIDDRAFRAQNIDSMSGKILRLNADGTGVADNPYYNGNPNDIRSKVYAYGFRNPFRLSIRPSDNLLVAADVGWNDWEELNVIKPGANYGWPCYEGNGKQSNTTNGGTGAYKDTPKCQQMYANLPANLTSPDLVYPHPPGSAIIGGLFYTGTNYPATYKDRYFYGDFVKSQIYNVTFTNKVLNANTSQTFASNTGGPVSFFPGPNGDIYYVAINDGAIYRINYSTNNQAPTAVAAADKTFGAAPLTVNFTSAGSTDPENGALSFAWDFGDGSPVSNSPNPAHTYADDGTYTAKLTVTDDFNNQSTKTLTIHAGQTAPELTITTPGKVTTAATNQTINFAGTAVDAVDGTMPGDKLNWTITIQHCPLDSCHTHTLLTTTGTNGSFVFPAHDGPFYLQIALSATNSLGITSTKTARVYPVGQKITNSLLLDGINDYVTAGNPQDFKRQEFTAEAMIKTLTTDTDGAEVMSAGNNWMVRILPDGNVDFTFTSGGEWHHVTTTGVKVTDSIWHHIAVTRTLTDAKIYVDGVLKMQGPFAGSIDYVNGEDFVLGRHGSGDDNYTFNGAIDEFRFWGTPRTDAQITQYKGSTLPAFEAAKTIAYVKAEEGDGTTAADISTAQNHTLTLLNGTEWTAGAPLVDPITTPQISDIKDVFTGTAIDAAKWQIVGTTSRVQQNGSLQVTPQNSGGGYHGVASKTRYQLANNAIFVEAPQTTLPGATETHMILELDASNRIFIGRSNNSLQLRHRVNGVNLDANIPFDAASMRWWRVSESAGTVRLETSPDATTWTTRRSFAKAFDITKLRVILQAGTWQTVANPGTGIFDNLNTAPSATKPKASLTFNGNGVATTNGNGLYNTQNFTLELWAKTQATALGGGELLSNGNNYGLRVMPNGDARFYMRTAASQWAEYTLAGANLKDNVWHHIALAKDSTSAKLYIDGVLRQTFAATQTIAYNTGNLTIGQHAKADPNFNLTGTIDEVRIWNTARTASQIQSNWKNELTVPQTGLIGYWQLNEAVGTAGADTSGNNHPLNLNTGTGWGANFPTQP